MLEPFPAYRSGKSRDEASGKMGSGKKFYHNATLEADFALCREKWPVHGGQLQLHQVIADAGAEVKAFNAYAKWCSDQAQVDGRQQETLDANIASTNAAIENASACSLYRTCRDCNS